MIIRYETENSVYEVDEAAGLYRRTTKNFYQAPEVRNPQGSPNMVEDTWLPLDTVNPNPVTIIHQVGLSVPEHSLRWLPCGFDHVAFVFGGW